MMSRLLLLMAACVAFSNPTLARVAAPPTPELFSPADGATNVSLPPILMWNRVEGAATYEWQATRASDFGYTLWSGSEDATQDQLQAHSFGYGSVSPGIDVYWRVRAVASDGSTGEWSSVWTFKTSSSNQGALLAQPGLLSPPHNEDWVPIPPRLVWQSVDGAVSYQYEANSVESFANPQWSGTVTPVEGDEQEYQFEEWEVMPDTTVYWLVRAIASDGTPGPWSEKFFFRTSPLMSPAPTSPANGATGVSLPPVLRWSDVPGAASYEFHAHTSSDLSSPSWYGYVEDRGTGDSGYWFEEGEVGEGTTIYWRVRAVAWNGATSSWTDTYSFRTVSGAPAAPMLVSPFNGDVRVPVPPRLAWLKTEGASSYVLQANTSNSFTSPRWTVNVTATSAAEQSHTFAAGEIPNGTQIFWRVRATGEGGVEGAWSGVYSFTTVAAPLGAPALVAPAGGATNVSVTPNLVWRKVTGASRYNVLVTKSLSTIVTTEVNDSGAEEQSFTVPSGRLSGGEYYCWKVQAIANDGTAGSYSPANCFTTEAAMPQFTMSIGNSVWGHGSVMRISWTGGNVEVIDVIAVDYNNPGSEFAVAMNRGSSSGSVDWTIPSGLYCGQCVVGIRKAGDNAYRFGSRLSPIFTVKAGYHLWKPAEGGGQVLFTPEKHGWSFSNTEPNLFPRSWWLRDEFNYGTIYGTGTEPYTRKKYPGMFMATRTWPTNASFFPDWPSFVDAFGASSAFSSLNPGGKSIYKNSFFQFWRDTHVSGGFWGGSCSGFAITALLNFHDPSFLSVRVGWFDELYTYKPDLDADPAARTTINAWQQHQFGKRTQGYLNRNWKKKPSQTLEQVKAMLLTETIDDDSWLAIFTYSGGHAVVPYKIEPDPSDTRYTRIYVYDPNAPGNSDLYVNVWSESEVWQYTGFSPQWENVNQGLYLLEPIANYKRNAVPNLSVEAAKTGSAEDSIFVEVVPAAGATVTIVGAEGSIGYADGTAFSTIPDAVPFIPAVGGPMHPTNYWLPEGSYDVSLTDFPDSSAYVSVRTAGIRYTYGREGAEAGEVDRLTLAGDGVTIHAGGAGEEVSLSALVPEQERTFVLTGFSMAEQDSLRLLVTGDAELQIANMGSAKAYTLELHQSTSEGASVVTRSEIVLEEGAGHTIAPDWQNIDTAPVPVEIDRNGDGQADETVELSMNHAPDAAVIVEPSAGASITLAGDPSTPVDVRWEPAVDLDGDELTYRWELSDSEAFLELLGSVDAGPATSLAATYGVLGEMLNVAGVPVGGSVELYHRVVVSDGQVETSSEAVAVTLTRGVITAVENSELPVAVALEQNYPNPFNPATVIRFGTPTAADVRLEVFDMLGRQVATLFKGQKAAGWHEVAFDAGGLPSGIYIYRLTAGESVSVKRLTLSR